MGEKLTKLVPVKLTDSMHTDLVAACGGVRERAGWIRARIAEGIERAKSEMLQPAVSVAEANAIAEARRHHIDVVTTLRDRIAQISP